MNDLFDALDTCRAPDGADTLQQRSEAHPEEGA